MREVANVVQNKNVSPLDTMDAIKAAGFKNIFIQWYDREEFEYSQETQYEYAKKLGLNIIFAHLGYDNINEIWNDGKMGDYVINEYIQNMKDLKLRGVDLVIVHLSTHKNPPAYNELGLERIKRLAKAAKEIGTKIAFENTRYQGYLEYILTNIPDEHIGICFDIGHYHTHFKDIFNFEFFKNRIFAVHLHDNDGTGIDQHLLPFDGNIDWDGTIKKLVDNGFTGPVTLESYYGENYLHESVFDFYKEAYNKANKVREIFEKYDK